MRLFHTSNFAGISKRGSDRSADLGVHDDHLGSEKDGVALCVWVYAVSVKREITQNDEGFQGRCVLNQSVQSTVVICHFGSGKPTLRQQVLNCFEP